MTHPTTLIAFFAVVGVGSMACNKDECHLGEDYCEGTTAWSCVERGCEDCSGHVWWTRDCSDSEGAICIELPGVGGKASICADPVCGALTDGILCVGDELITCRNNYRTAETSCAAGLCITAHDGGFCTLTSEPADICSSVTDSRPGAGDGDGSCCMGPDKIDCRGGYVVGVSPSGCGYNPPPLNSCDACTRGSDPLCLGYPCDVEMGSCEITPPCAAGYVWNSAAPTPLYCEVDQSAPFCSDGCGAYVCVEALDRCATHCIDDLDCAADAVCTDGACT